MPLVRGSTVALVTPFDKDTGAINFAELRTLLQWHVAAGTQNLCILGTTGEANLLSKEERTQVLQTAVEEVKGRLPILAGTGTINPNDVLSLTQEAADLGCDAVLVVTPYYVKPPQRGLVQHFVKLADSPNTLPIVIYNVPGRTAVNMLDENIATCAQHESIVAVKDATGDIGRVQILKRLLQEQQQRASSSASSFLCLSGDDATTLDFCLNGGDGCISVTANVAPVLVRQVLNAALGLPDKDGTVMAQDVALAKQLNDQIMGLHKYLFCESNPIPTKWALTQPIQRLIGEDSAKPLLSSDYCRPPLTSLDPECRTLVQEALRQASLL